MCDEYVIETAPDTEEKGCRFKPREALVLRLGRRYRFRNDTEEKIEIRFFSRTNENDSNTEELATIIEVEGQEGTKGVLELDPEAAKTLRVSGTSAAGTGIWMRIEWLSGSNQGCQCGGSGNGADMRLEELPDP